MIDSYYFGKIIINGQEYNRDVIVHPGYVEPNWWRKKGHELCIDDIKTCIEKESPDILIMGTGAYGQVTILDSTKKYLDEKGIEFFAEDTEKACRTYNQLIKTNKKVIGAFHLTC